MTSAGAGRASPDAKLMRERTTFDNVLQEHEEMHRVRRGGHEIEFQIETPRHFVLRMHRESAYAGNIGRLQRAQDRVL